MFRKAGFSVCGFGVLSGEARAANNEMGCQLPDLLACR